jgi:DNA-binding transcriptional MerR regulator
MVLAPAAAVARSKSPEAFRTISEVSVELDIPQHVLRFWEGRFAQVRPIKRAGGRRYYRPEDVDLLRGIRALLYSDGFTIRGVQKILRERGLRHVAEIGRASFGAPAPDAEAGEPVVTEPTHARAALAALARAHAERPIGWQLPEDRRVKLELLLAELLHLKVRLREAREGAAAPA